MANNSQNGKNFRYHPACKLFPVMPDDQLQQLADDIRKNGLLEPILIHDGEILDGRNRLLACEKVGVEPDFVEWDGDSTPTERVISGNLMRRDLTAGQRALIGAELLPLLKEEAADRQRLSKGRGVKGAKAAPTFKGKASEKAAKIVGVNSRYVE